MNNRASIEIETWAPAKAKARVEAALAAGFEVSFALTGDWYEAGGERYDTFHLNSYDDVRFNRKARKHVWEARVDGAWIRVAPASGDSCFYEPKAWLIVRAPEGGCNVIQRDHTTKVG